MNCKIAVAMIEDFRENCLDTAHKDEFLDHLGQCKSCRHVLAGVDAVDGGLKSTLGQFAVSAQFPARMAAALRQAEMKPVPPMVILWRKPLLAAAACLVACLSIGFIFAAFRGNLVSSGPGMPKATSIVEPAGGQSYAIGKEFVIGDGGGIAAYSGKGRISIKQVNGGVPELIVEAFPK